MADTLRPRVDADTAKKLTAYVDEHHHDRLETLAGRHDLEPDSLGLGARLEVLADALDEEQQPQPEPEPIDERPRFVNRAPSKPAKKPPGSHFTPGTGRR